MTSDRPRNIYIIGAQCTGKTTLLEAIQNHYAQNRVLIQPTIISEVARQVLNMLDVDREEIATSSDRSFTLQNAILKAQYEREALLGDTASSWYISDRSGIDPIVYARYYVGVERSMELLASPQWSFLERKMKAGLVVLCEAGAQWLTDDGTRLMPKDQADWIAFDNAFRALLKESDIRYIVIANDMVKIGDRVAAVVEAHHGEQSS